MRVRGRARRDTRMSRPAADLERGPSPVEATTHSRSRGRVRRHRGCSPWRPRGVAVPFHDRREAGRCLAGAL